jgi:hypothetical protein
MAVIMAAMVALFPGSVIFFMVRSSRKQVVELTSLLQNVIRTESRKTDGTAT